MDSRDSRLRWLLWLLALALWAGFVLFPISNRLTRLGVLSLFLVCWCSLLALTWSRRGMRIVLLSLTIFAAGLLLMPARAFPAVESLRTDYVTGLRRYQGVRYIWGGESPKGIDCSGLIRRGLIDSLFWRGVRGGNPGLVRDALSLWWNDCTANDLRENRTGLTVRLLETPSLNELDHTRILPGDLAVTRGGVHILAYLGGQEWIEADPLLGRVVSMAVPAKDNPWFDAPVELVRWSVLAH